MLFVAIDWKHLGFRVNIQRGLYSALEIFNLGDELDLMVLDFPVLMAMLSTANSSSDTATSSGECPCLLFYFILFFSVFAACAELDYATLFGLVLHHLK